VILLGDEPEAFDLLQIPPLELGQVEVIKGAASALYGSSALGGLVNLTSRTPDSPSTVLLNATSRGGREVSAFLTDDGTGALSGTLTAGASSQSRQDVDRDPGPGSGR
jgi:outer membrane receptor for ferrienterochelin and colicins